MFYRIPHASDIEFAAAQVVLLKVSAGGVETQGIFRITRCCRGHVDTLDQREGVLRSLEKKSVGASYLEQAPVTRRFHKPFQYVQSRAEVALSDVLVG